MRATALLPPPNMEANAMRNPARLLTTLLFLAVAAGPAASEMAGRIYKSATCGCCSAWVKHMRANGFTLKELDVANGELARRKTEAGIRPEHASCHTAIIGGYAIEGHVPAGDVARLLKERPEAVGLAVPGMPIGSPGMESGETREPFEVLLVKKDGTAEVFARHNQ
ncbi:MAG: DUF411 domain-containing protein [Pseudomonadota bacterium]